MATVKISALPSATSLSTSDVLAVNHSGVTRQATVAQLASTLSYGRAIYGDGADGDVTIGSDTTITRDMYYNNLTVSSGFNLITANYRVHVKDTLTVNGTVHNDGTVGATAGGTTTASSGGAPINTNASLGYGSTGGAGNYNTAGSTGGSLSLPSSNPIGTGGAGGAGSSTAGGAATTLTATLNRAGSWHSGMEAVTGRLHALGANALNGTATTYVLPGGGAGGGGGGDGTRAGGGGGSGGGPVLIVARTIVVASGGVIRSKGGDGGAGVSGGNTGGGGAGAGGPVILVYDSLTETGTVASQAGTGGNKQGTGVNGSNGGTSSVIRLSNQ